jgi:hypothetical protein
MSKFYKYKMKNYSRIFKIKNQLEINLLRYKI